MDHFRVSEFNGLTGPMYGVEYTQNDGASWITTSVHNTPAAADREMRGYVAAHPECSLWEGSIAQKIFDARPKVEYQESAKEGAAHGQDRNVR